VERPDLVLAALASADGGSFTPVQVQKLFFLVDRNISGDTGGPHFNFHPYSYGPFDKAVYEELERLNEQGLVDIDSTGSVKSFRLTVSGQAKGTAASGLLPENARHYIGEVTAFVRSLPFSKLVSAIYRAYPEMRQNSVFQE
jgi:uncharacterized protein